MDGKEEDEKGYKGSLACISNVITVIPITTITSAALHCNSHCPRIPSCNLHPASPSLCWPRHPPTTRHPSPLSHAPKPLQTHFRPPTTQITTSLNTPPECASGRPCNTDANTRSWKSTHSTDAETAGNLSPCRREICHDPLSRRSRLPAVLDSSWQGAYGGLQVIEVV